jgi:hypothetical protein
MVESGERYPGKVEIIEPNVIGKNCSIPEFRKVAPKLKRDVLERCSQCFCAWQESRVYSNALQYIVGWVSGSSSAWSQSVRSRRDMLSRFLSPMRSGSFRSLVEGNRGPLRRPTDHFVETSKSRVVEASPRRIRMSVVFPLLMARHFRRMQHLDISTTYATRHWNDPLPAHRSVFDMYAPRSNQGL